MPDFTQALKYVLANEGGFVNRPEDKGGPTKFGITQSTATLYFKRAMTVDDMKALKVNEASEIYLNWYWKAVHLEDLDSQAIATCLFDTDVNCGQSRVVYLTEQVLGSFQIEVTEKETWRDVIRFLNCIDETEFIKRFYQGLVVHYHSIVAKNQKQSVFLEGWLNRANRLLTLIKDHA